MRITSQLLRKIGIEFVERPKQYKAAAKVGELTKQYANFPDSYVQRSMEQVRKNSLPMYTFNGLIFILT